MFTSSKIWRGHITQASYSKIHYLISNIFKLQYWNTRSFRFCDSNTRIELLPFNHDPCNNFNHFAPTFEDLGTQDKSISPSMKTDNLRISSLLLWWNKTKLYFVRWLETRIIAGWLHYYFTDICRKNSSFLSPSKDKIQNVSTKLYKHESRYLKSSFFTFRIIQYKNEISHFITREIFISHLSVSKEIQKVCNETIPPP